MKNQVEAKKEIPEKDDKHFVWRFWYINKDNPFSVIKVILICIVALALFIFVMESFVQQNSIYNQISNAEEVLDDLHSDNIQMQTTIEGKISISNIKEYAEEHLGMQKLDKSQIHYLSIQDEDEVEIEDSESNIFVRIKNWFKNAVVYLKG